jgi:hypothetical protein
MVADHRICTEDKLGGDNQNIVKDVGKSIKKSVPTAEADRTIQVLL